MSLRSNRNFRLLWIGQILSDVGTQWAMRLFAIALAAVIPIALVLPIPSEPDAEPS